jgi:hypothetical protein
MARKLKNPAALSHFRLLVHPLLDAGQIFGGAMVSCCKRDAASWLAPWEFDRNDRGRNDDTPLRLADPAAIAFPHGGMTVSGLRREAAKGRLAISHIAGKQFTTLRAIRR